VAVSTPLATPPDAFPAAPSCSDLAPPPRRRNGFAIASLVLGILAPCGGGLFSLIFGIIALVQTRKRQQAGKGLAIAGLACTGLWTAGIAVALTISVLNHDSLRDGSGEIIRSGPVSLESLAPGDCLADVAGGVSRSLPAVPCAEPHLAEVYAVFELPLDGAWPGQDSIDAAAQTECIDRYDDFTSIPYDVELMDIFVFSPTSGGWLTGDRGVTCVVDFLDTPRTGSLAG
jgi:hypothetical protein